MSRTGWLLVVGSLVLPAGAVGQGFPAEAETEITIDQANHFGGGIGFGGPLGVLWRVSGSGGKSVLFSWGLGVLF